MLIGFIHEGKAFLPEAEAYADFFCSKGVKVLITVPERAGKNPMDIEWHFMGTHYRRNNSKAVVIHEYTSASTPPFAKLKNLVKKAWNCQPDYRLFLNEYVRNRFSFSDKKPFGIRDMGIPDYFRKTTKSEKKEFDFIYAGDISPRRKPSRLFNCFTNGRLSGHSLLILSRDYNHLLKEYATFPNIRFEGPVNHSQVPIYLDKARFAINFIPSIEPFNHQTSTKLLEYAAMNIPIITTDYNWINAFQKKYGGNYFFLDNNLDNFTWENVCNHVYSFPDLTDWNWENQIARSGILGFLNSKFSKQVL